MIGVQNSRGSTMKGLLNRAAAAFTDVVRKREEELRAVHQSIGNLNSNNCDLPWEDYLSLSLLLLEFNPDLVIELGRGLGTSTALFRYWNFHVVSICNSSLWQSLSLSALQQVKPIDWSAGVDAYVEDIRAANYRQFTSGARRVLIFWDAHGIEIAETVFNNLL